METNVLECIISKGRWGGVGREKPEKYLLEKLELRCNLILSYWN